MDDFLIQDSQNLKSKDFIVKTEDMTRNKKGKRVFLNDTQTRHLMKQLNKFFESFIHVPRMRVGKRQTIETYIKEETLLFAKFLRDERESWVPKVNKTI
jgi:hypothetical protein